MNSRKIEHFLRVTIFCQSSWSNQYTGDPVTFCTFPGFGIGNQNHWVSQWSSSRILILDNKWLIDKLKEKKCGDCYDWISPQLYR